MPIFFQHAAFLVILVTLLTLTSINAQWTQGYTVDLLTTTNTPITSANFGTPVTIGFHFSSKVDNPDTTINRGEITFAYGASSYINNVTNCHAMTDGESVSLPNVEYTWKNTNNGASSNYTISFDVVNVGELISGTNSIIYCDVNFSGFPTSSVTGYSDGCLTVDIFHEDLITGNQDYGYTGYVPRNSYDKGNCLQFNAEDPLNTQHNTIFNNIFSYINVQIITFKVDAISNNHKCASVLSTLSNYQDDVVSFFKQHSDVNGNLFVSVSLADEGCQRNNSLYSSSVQFLVLASGDPATNAVTYANSRSGTALDGYSIDVSATSYDMAPSCDDGIKNGDETDIDCGGSCLSKRCEDSKKCRVNSDCFNQDCQYDVCSSSGSASDNSAAGMISGVLSLCSVVILCVVSMLFM